MSARLTKSLQQNDNAGGNRRHRDHSTRRAKDWLKIRHNRLWKRKTAQRMEKLERTNQI